MNMDKKVRFVQPVTSSSNIPKQNDSLRTKYSSKPLLTFTGVNTTTSASGSKPTGNTKNNRISQSSSSNNTNKVEDQSKSVKSRKNKKNRVVKTECNDHVMQSMLNVNSKSICAICNECLFDENHDKYVLNFVHDVNVLAKSKRANHLEVAFRKHTCFIRDLKGVDLLKGSRGSNLYTLSLDNMMSSSPICLLSKASKTKSWLWHRRVSHLNFNYIIQLAKQGLFCGLPKLKYQKDHLYSACALGKSKKHSHKPKAEDSIQEKLYLLHMDLCGPMRIQSINERKYILVIVDDYSRTDNGTKFVNQTLRAYHEEVRISHQTSVARTLQQNGAEVVATGCYTQNRSLIQRRHNKTPYELLHDRKPNLSYLQVFGALCYPTNNGEDLGMLKPKADIGIFVGYDPAKKAFQIYNKRTRMIIETIHVDFNDLTAMTSEQFSSGPRPKLWTPGTISSGFMQNTPFSTPYIEALTESSYIESMQEEFNEFERLKVWELKFLKGTVDPTLFSRREGKDILLILRGIFLNQSKYALESLKKYGMETCDPVDTLMVEKSKLDEDP
ncbi:retrovirus-related pol polyprotein from transposon TNT 1-94 [Tanacetum coccineum]|uniref:Retrovirus-related pol polyprotein from transposon TNT 1-94 n=1 Tax=Tanacetum coccineum TaxID=301880 RepID=A0ABQ5BTD9_9ASTR